MSDRKFTESHEWVIIENELALVGISDFAQKQLGDIVSVELPKVGEEFKKKDTIAIIDSIKASSDIYCPIDGMIEKINEELIEHPELINKSPYESGWIVKIKPRDKGQLDSLMTQEQYDKFVGED
ncbi:MAG: glycine cleavage system protein GcvH [Thaumarchaeota archaeon]|nr:glycine cleavage system protein GcvH [Nitrososphaerota archaeon]